MESAATKIWWRVTGHTSRGWVGGRGTCDKLRRSRHRSLSARPNSAGTGHAGLSLAPTALRTMKLYDTSRFSPSLGFYAKQHSGIHHTEVVP